MPKKKQSVQTDNKKPTIANSGKAPHGSKSAFVRGLPRDLSAKEVVEKAAAAGMTLSIAQVYNIRSTSKPKGGKRGRRAQAAPARAAAAPSPAANANSEAQLRRLIAEVGLARARHVLAEVGAAFAG